MDGGLLIFNGLHAAPGAPYTCMSLAQMHVPSAPSAMRSIHASIPIYTSCLPIRQALHRCMSLQLQAGVGVHMLRGRGVLGFLVCWCLVFSVSCFRSFLVSSCLGFKVSRFLSFLVSRFIDFLFFCFLVSWFLGLLVSWFLLSGFVGFLSYWFLGFEVSWFLGFKVSWLQNSQKFQRPHITKIPIHVFRKILIQYPRFSRFY